MKLAAALAATSLSMSLAMPMSAAHALVGPATEDASLAAYTVMVLNSVGRGSSSCSGVVVAPNVVLTAGHCVAKLESTLVHFPDGAGRPALRPIIAIAVHPQYRANAVATRERSIDLALVRLAENLPGSFRPVTFDTNASISVGARFRIAGYGLAREGVGNSGGVLRSGVLTARAPLSSILLWAEDPTQKGLGACTGDSGGPIFSEDASRLIAITSWAAGASGRGCGRLTQAVLIAPQRAWIESVLRGWSGR